MKIVTEQMKLAFGYDEFGNNPDLLAPIDQEKLEDGDWVRASGETICPVCGTQFYNHPTVQGALWLVRTCEERLVHL